MTDTDLTDIVATMLKEVKNTKARGPNRKPRNRMDHLLSKPAYTPPEILWTERHLTLLMEETICDCGQRVTTPLGLYITSESVRNHCFRHEHLHPESLTAYRHLPLRRSISATKHIFFCPACCEEFIAQLKRDHNAQD